MASLPVLTFHAVDDQPSVISFPPRLFERGMALLYDCGFHALSLLEVVERLRQGLPFPERSFAITFDDGYQSVYQHAFPLLQRYGFSATVFLAVGENGNHTGSERLPSMCERSMLSWHEIREMHYRGMTFGAHTLTHPALRDCRASASNSRWWVGRPSLRTLWAPRSPASPTLSVAMITGAVRWLAITLSAPVRTSWDSSTEIATPTQWNALTPTISAARNCRV